MNSKKPLFIALIALDVALTVFFLVISVIMLVKNATMTAAEIQAAEGFIGYLQNHTTFYFLLFVLPLFVLLAANIVGLVIYVKKTSKKDLKDLTEEQKEALRKELLEEFKNEK